jgi:hypothetical protein
MDVPALIVKLKDAKIKTQINLNQNQKNPTLKQLFSKENLTSYIEAARHKPLFEEVK